MKVETIKNHRHYSQRRVGEVYELPSKNYRLYAAMGWIKPYVPEPVKVEIPAAVEPEPEPEVRKPRVTRVYKRRDLKAE